MVYFKAEIIREDMTAKIFSLCDKRKEIELLTIWHDCHRCGSKKAVPQNIKTEKYKLEKECPKCGKTIAIW